MAFDRGAERQPTAPVVEKPARVGVMGPGAGVVGVVFFMLFTIGGTILAAGSFDELRDSITANANSFNIDKEKLSNAVLFLLLAASAGGVLQMLRTLSRPGV